MNSLRRWEILLSVWMQVVGVPVTYCRDGALHHLSREDRLLLKDEQEPKCFTRTEEDLTCFFETRDNRTFDFLYSIDRTHSRRPKEKRCDLSARRTEEGTFLHVCSFPCADVVTYVETHLRVVERDTNASLCSRVVSVEDQVLLDPPFNVSLLQNGQAGQLQVSWHTNVSKYWRQKVQHRIRYTSRGLGEKTKEGKQGGDAAVLTLPPGEQVEVQVSVKCAHREDAGHWSRWSPPATAVAPQSADDISLLCWTADLQTVTCRWNGSRYGEHRDYTLCYKMHLREASGWSRWEECRADGQPGGLCSFRGDESGKVLVKLSGRPAPLGRTFYTQEFTLDGSVKTSPPGHLRGAVEGGRLCLRWEAPLLSLSAHLQYEVGYRIKEREVWMTMALKGPATATCVQVPAGDRYSVKVRSRPNGSLYSGHWSDWSEVLAGETPIGIDTWLMMCIPATMLVTAVIIISTFSRYFRKLKQHFWPPVPNLEKVLQGFLTEINNQTWDPPVSAKQIPEEAASSVVEVMSRDEGPGLARASEESSQLLPPEEGRCRGEREEGPPGTQVKVFPDYVTLNRDSVMICVKGNRYEQVGEKRGDRSEGERPLKTCRCSRSEGNDLLNQSYLPLAEPADRFGHKVTAERSPGNLYTNLPSS